MMNGVCKEKSNDYKAKSLLGTLKKDYNFEVKVMVTMDEIPMEFKISFDQTGIHYVSV